MTRVRPARADDLSALARLNAEVQALHRAAMPHRYRDPSLDEIEDWVRQLLSDGDVSVLVAEGDGAAIGFAVVRRSQTAGNTFALPRLAVMVDAIGVAADARRRGAGRALMAAAEELARSWGSATLSLDVQGFNREAEQFYRALGYHTATTRMAKKL
jgi:ribosomal protein S18 acetylase RimI-like enzyme